MTTIKWQAKLADAVDAYVQAGKDRFDAMRRAGVVLLALDNGAYDEEFESHADAVAAGDAIIRAHLASPTDSALRNFRSGAMDSARIAESIDTLPDGFNAEAAKALAPVRRKPNGVRRMRATLKRAQKAVETGKASSLAGAIRADRKEREGGSQSRGPSWLPSIRQSVDALRKAIVPTSGGGKGTQAFLSLPAFEQAISTAIDVMGVTDPTSFATSDDPKDAWTPERLEALTESIGQLQAFADNVTAIHAQAVGADA